MQNFTRNTLCLENLEIGPKYIKYQVC